MSDTMKVKAKVDIELLVGVGATHDDVDNLIHETWGAGDPEDATKAVICVEDIVQVYPDRDPTRLPDSSPQAGLDSGDEGAMPDPHLDDGPDPQ